VGRRLAGEALIERPASSKGGWRWSGCWPAKMLLQPLLESGMGWCCWEGVPGLVADGGSAGFRGDRRRRHFVFQIPLG